jgi:SAM-dependent methyltransferase
VNAGAPEDPAPDPPQGAWFNPIAEFLGPAYLRNAFTYGTEQEVGFLIDALGLRSGSRVLDVGCGPGRHALALARRGCRVHGVDLSPEFIDLAERAAAAEGLDATFEVLDVRDLPGSAGYDAAICICQGGFGLLGGDEEEEVFARIVAAVRPGGGLAVSAFHAHFAVRHLEAGESFDARTGVLHEVATLRDTEGREAPFDLWTTTFTAREMRLLAERAGLEVLGVHGVSPGDYTARPPALDRHEVLLVARRGADR